MNFVFFGLIAWTSIGTAISNDARNGLPEYSALAKFDNGAYHDAFNALRQALPNCPCSEKAAQTHQRVAEALSAHHEAIIALETGVDADVGSMRTPQGVAEAHSTHHHAIRTYDSDAHQHVLGSAFGPSLLTMQAHELKATWWAQEADERFIPDGWAEVDKVLAEAEARQTTELWKLLRDKSRSVMQSDVFRAAGWNFVYSPAMVSHLQNLVTVVKACQNDPACCTIDISKEVANGLVRKRPTLSILLGIISASHTVPQKRAKIEDLKRYLEGENAQFSVRRRAAVNRQTEGRWRVAIDPGPYREACDTMSDIMAEFWHHEGQQVVLECISPGAKDELCYRMVPTKNNLPHHVNHSDQTINIGPVIARREFAHEMGHVLGLPDFYYFVWDETRCEYKSFWDGSDLMSYAYSGSVSSRCWQLLDNTYPLEP